ncbi:MAG: inorganic diphosphatase [Patescibacteria group bacterium]|nr:inorganic diphosphatase [Patescibacteria group bacterium]
MKNKTRSFLMASKYLGKEVEVFIDRPLGTKHPKHGFLYLANYGYIPNTKAPDGEELDVYFLGVNTPVNRVKGKVIAVIHRLNDDDDKLIVVPKNIELTNDEISIMIDFQEKWNKYEIIRVKSIASQI